MLEVPRTGWLPLLMLCVVAQAAETLVDDRYLESGGDGSNWPAYGRTSTEQRYSPLAVDGVIYFTGSYSRTYAVDARSGKLIWEFDPKTIEHAGDRLRVMWDINRGPALVNL